MVWVLFVSTALAIVVAAYFLAKYGDVIAVRTGLGGMFIGILLMAGATSLPELLTSMEAVKQNSPNIAAGNLMGSNAFNMVLLAVLDLMHRSQRILRKAAMRHALTGSLAIMMIGLVLYFIAADIQVKIGFMGLDSIIIIAAYVFALRVISGEPKAEKLKKEEIPDDTPKLWVGLIGFALAAGVLILVTPLMVRSSVEIAEITGLGTTFVGTAMVAFVTSLPELVTTIAAIRIGASDMAIGNLFGSNMFNMFALGLTDLFYTQGRFLGTIDPAFMLVGLFGLLMTSIGLVGNLAKLETRIWFIEIDSLLLFILYFSGMWLLYQHGIG
ncbi:MAG: sodium:proton exchanger [Chloroflexi bacterium HGW-Chloroflexi-3]|nr:MAG: sodium:proton exchanger [Chloroflexi bacterium HGW-Chloroflexi-3]